VARFRNHDPLVPTENFASSVLFFSTAMSSFVPGALAGALS
jgi:hypothetical protein